MDTIKHFDHIIVIHMRILRNGRSRENINNKHPISHSSQHEVMWRMSTLNEAFTESSSDVRYYLAAGRLVPTDACSPSAVKPVSLI
jgi:hypothetical protein